LRECLPIELQWINYEYNVKFEIVVDIKINGS
jgi:hypothetical protein